MFPEIIILQCNFLRFNLPWGFALFELCAILEAAFKIVFDALFELTNNVAHNSDVYNLRLSFCIVPFDFMQAIESDYQAIRVLAHILVVFLEERAELGKLTIRNGLHLYFLSLV